MRHVVIDDLHFCRPFYLGVWEAGDKRMTAIVRRRGPAPLDLFMPLREDSAAAGKEPDVHMGWPFHMDRPDAPGNDQSIAMLVGAHVLQFA